MAKFVICVPDLKNAPVTAAALELRGTRNSPHPTMSAVQEYLSQPPQRLPAPGSELC